MQLITSGLSYGQTVNRGPYGTEQPNLGSASQQPKAVQQQILATLGAHLNQVQIDEVLKADPNDFSAEKVSSRIADFVAAGLANAAARGAPAERLESMYQAAVAGVQRGFAEAKAILEEMPEYIGNKSVQGLVADTEALILSKLDELNPAGADAPADTALSAAVDYRESMKLKLVTQDGDKVEVRFTSRESYSFASAGDDWRFDSTARSGFQFKVVGELDVEEIDAIERLLSEVSEVADAFYGGNVDQAFERAAELGVDSQELASMDLNLKQSSRLEVAQYTAVERQSHPEHPWAQRLQSWLEPLEGLQQRAAELIAPESVSLGEMITQAIDVRGAKPGFPPGLSRLLAERLS